MMAVLPSTEKETESVTEAMGRDKWNDGLPLHDYASLMAILIADGIRVIVSLSPEQTFSPWPEFANGGPGGVHSRDGRMIDRGAGRKVRRCSFPIGSVIAISTAYHSVPSGRVL